VLKSGTNQWHGSLFEYNRIQALAANSFFSNQAGIKDALVRNQFGVRSAARSSKTKPSSTSPQNSIAFALLLLSVEP